MQESVNGVWKRDDIKKTKRARKYTCAETINKRIAQQDGPS